MATSDLFLLIFVWIDELLKENPAVLRRPGPDPIVSDAEMMTLMLMQALAGEISDEAWLRRVARDFGDCFPRLPERTRYQRRRAILESALKYLVDFIQSALGEDPRLRVIDSAPIPVCHNVRARRCRSFAGEATWGWCAAKKAYFYGFRLHLLITEQGLPVAWTVLTAKCHDRKGLDALTADQSGLDLYGDSACLVRAKDRQRFAAKDITITAAPKRNMKPLPRRKARILKRVRFRVDWVLGLLSRVFGVQKTLARSAHALLERVSFSLAAFSVGVWINVLLQRPWFKIKSLAA